MEFWEFFLVMAIVLPIMVLWLGCIIDVISRPDISGWSKAAWMLFILFLPLIGAIVYAITRPRYIDARAGARDAYSDAYSDAMRVPTAETQASGATMTEPKINP
jgi:hypothetical protein